MFPLEHDADRIALSAAGKAARIAVIVVAVLALVFSVYLIAGGVNEISLHRVETLVDLARNPLIALMVGLLATAAVQSSSTVTALVVASVATGILELDAAIPIILGANIGTTVTPMIVSFSYLHDKQDFRTAHSTAALHLWFNTVFVLLIFPIEYFFGPMRHLAPHIDLPGEPLRVETFIELARLVPFHGMWSIVAGIVVLVASIRLIDDQLKHLLTPLAWKLLGHTSSGSAAFGFGAGMLLTVLIQASSAVVSATLPFATAKLADLRGYMAVILGANVGTTMLAVITAFATPGDYPTVAFQAAIVHVAFNVFGALVVALIGPMRRLIYRLARMSGRIAERSVWLTFGAMALGYFIVPALLISVYSLLEM
ncbi:Na/Pi symporter [Corynebacterium breve]|uniref:Na/Pi symporter n=1 Tax=Corynebacterium breve TaxID=3049799 RepID=A0ABY8VF68_9CORY|nr:Na/Pi symporter [Corynebacterium breve]WIM67405.1 Na/Pi symporter [Corynebacterium breve]